MLGVCYTIDIKYMIKRQIMNEQIEEANVTLSKMKVSLNFT